MKQAQVYGQLADMAHSWGYPKVTGAAVHDWRKRGLLPPVRVHRLGFGRTETEIPAAVVERLRTVCGLRFDQDMRDLRVIGLALWLNGTDMEMVDVRAGARAAATMLSRHLRRTGSQLREREDDANADIDAAAVRLGKGRRVLTDAFGGRQIGDDEAVTAIDEFLRAMTGRSRARDVDPDALRPLESSVGLDRARTESPPGTAPWLDGAIGSGLEAGIAQVNEVELVGRLDRASDQDLHEARDVMHALTGPLATTRRFLELALPPGAFGLGFLGPLADRPALGQVLIFLNAIALPDASRATAAALEEATSNLEALIELGRRWLDEHPEAAADAERRGLKTVLDEVAGDGS